MIRTVEELEDRLSAPPEYVSDALRRTPGDVLILGAAGKMGPTLARMVRRAATDSRRVIAVARFSDERAQHSLEAAGIETIRADLLDDAALCRLPDCPNVIYMAGMKFGATGKEAMTWAMNCYLPGRVFERFRHSRIALFSTGNVYGLVPTTGGGSVESDPLNPTGDYAMSCVGRERISAHFSNALQIPMTIIRLNYACELRYGVLVDLGQKLWNRQPIDLTMGHFNVIWQGDANAMSIASLAHAMSPALALNVSGPEILRVRDVSVRLALRMGVEAKFVGSEAGNALLNNAKRSHELFGKPSVSVETMLDWTADWIRRGGTTLNKPTHFETRDGKF